MEEGSLQYTNFSSYTLREIYMYNLQNVENFDGKLVILTILVVLVEYFSIILSFYHFDSSLNKMQSLSIWLLKNSQSDTNHEEKKV